MCTLLNSVSEYPPVMHLKPPVVECSRYVKSVLPWSVNSTCIVSIQKGINEIGGSVCIGQLYAQRSKSCLHFERLGTLVVMSMENN